MGYSNPPPSMFSSRFSVKSNKLIYVPVRIVVVVVFDKHLVSVVPDSRQYNSMLATRCVSRYNTYRTSG